MPEDKFPKLAPPCLGEVLEWKDLLGVVVRVLTDEPSKDECDLMAEILVLHSDERQLEPGDTWHITAKQLGGSKSVA
jgi:hypothetical protein